VEINDLKINGILKRSKALSIYRIKKSSEVNTSLDKKREMQIKNILNLKLETMKLMTKSRFLRQKRHNIRNHQNNQV
jgi:hypothetical protein